MKKLICLLFISASSVVAQDTIRFTNGNAAPVKVNEIGENEIKYNRWDNISGPVYVVAKSDVRYIRYVNGMKDTFAIAKPKVETPVTTQTDTPVYETPQYVNMQPPVSSQQQIIILRKRLYYNHHMLSDKTMLSLIRQHPVQGEQNLMLKEFSKISAYKNNRVIGQFLLYGGIATAVISMGSSSGAGFLLGNAACISGSIISIVNRNRRNNKRVEVARMYNSSIQLVK